MYFYPLGSEAGNEGGLGGRPERVRGRKKSRVFHKDLSRPLGMEAEDEERPEQVVYYRAGDESEGLCLEEKRERKDLKLEYLPT